MVWIFNKQRLRWSSSNRCTNFYVCFTDNNPDNGSASKWVWTA